MRYPHRWENQYKCQNWFWQKYLQPSIFTGKQININWVQTGFEDADYETVEDSFDAIKIDPTIEDAPFKYRGPKDENGLPHHCGTMTYENGDVVTCGFRHGKRNGEVVIMSPRSDIARLVGTYQRGQLEGRGRVIDNSTQVTDCFFHRGSIHGPVRKFAMKKFRVCWNRVTVTNFYSAS